jgi:hypothetical protein
MDFFDSFFNLLECVTLENFFFEELVTVILLYNFFKLIVMSSLMELIWPTHFFNRKNTILFQFCRKRAFLEFLIYLFRPFIRNIVINRFFVKYIFIRK